MKRDMDLCRRILIAIEESEGSPRDWVALDFDDYSDEFVSYQVMQLSNAGLINASHWSGLSGETWQAKSLTWAGHEFLDSCRNDGLWSQAKSVVLEGSGGLTFELLRDALTSLGKRAVASLIG